MAERWPVIFPGYKLMRFLDTKVTCQQIIMMPANKLCSEDFRDIREGLDVQHAVNIVLAF